MQAASVSVNPSSQVPQADRSRVPNPADPGGKAPHGASFLAILGRSLRGIVGAEQDAAPRRNPRSGYPERSAANRGQASGVAAGAARRAGRSGVSADNPARAGAVSAVRPGPEAAEADMAVTPRDAKPAAAANRSGPENLGPSPGRNTPEAAELLAKSRERKQDSLSRTEESAAAAAVPAPKPAARAAEARAPAEEPSVDGPGAGRRRGDRKDLKVSVVDLRMRPEDPEAEGGGKPGGTTEGPSTVRETVPAGARPADAPVPADRPSNSKPAQGSGFSEILARHMADAGAQDIVKAAHIVLRDGDAGMIRLRLEPESLGNVKIELKMSEKNITGRIIVETDEARNAFERSLSSLRDAFTESGFETASLEVSVGGGQAEGGGDPAEPGAGPFFTERLREFDRSLPAAPDLSYGRDGTVNVWA